MSPQCFESMKSLDGAIDDSYSRERSLVDLWTSEEPPKKKSVRPFIHTSDSQSAPASDEYRMNWERIFGRRS